MVTYFKWPITALHLCHVTHGCTLSHTPAVCDWYIKMGFFDIQKALLHYGWRRGMPTEIVYVCMILWPLLELQMYFVLITITVLWFIRVTTALQSSKVNWRWCVTERVCACNVRQMECCDWPSEVGHLMQMERCEWLSKEGAVLHAIQIWMVWSAGFLFSAPMECDEQKQSCWPEKWGGSPWGQDEWKLHYYFCTSLS